MRGRASAVRCAVACLLPWVATGVGATEARARALDISASAVQATAGPPPLTLPQAIAEAVATHPELSALRARYEADRLKPATERFLMPPMLEVQVFEWPLDTVNPGDARLMLMAGQQFPGRGKRAARVALAEREATISAADVAVREQEIALRVRRAYANLQLAREIVGLYRDTVDLLRQVADMAEAKYAAGRMGQQDVLKAIVERSLVEEQIVTAEERASLAEAALNVLLDRPADAPIGAVDALAPEITIPAAADMQRLALDQQPELAAVDADIARREAALVVATTERRPDYVVQGGFMVMPNATNAWTARVGVVWPEAPWARGRLDAIEREAAAQVEAGRAERRAVENALRLKVQEAWIAAAAAQRRAELLRTSVLAQAGHVLDVSRAAYLADRVDILNVLDNQRRLLEVEISIRTALAARDLALADLTRAVGHDVPSVP